MIIDYKLTYPSGTATAVLINGFHTSKGDKTAKYVLYTCSWILFFKLFHTLNYWLFIDDSLFFFWQETDSWLYKIVLLEFLLGLLWMVLLRWWLMWLLSVPYIWITSLEKIVSFALFILCFLCFCCHIINMFIKMFYLFVGDTAFSSTLVWHTLELGWSVHIWWIYRCSLAQSSRGE